MAEDTYIQTLEKVSISVDGESYDLVAASFRGVPFFVDSYQQGGLGRTIATKKIPFSDRFVREDIGANVPTHTMSIYLIGDDCDVQKQNLIAACKKEGVAELVHPWLGKFNARVSQLSFSATKSDLAYVKGTITIEQEDELANKTVVISKKLETKVKAESFRDKFKSKFLDKISSVIKAGKASLDEAAAFTEECLDIISDCRNTLNEVNEFVNEIGKIKANVDVILQTPADFAARIMNLVTTTAEIFGYDVDKQTEAEEYIAMLGDVEGGNVVGNLVRNTTASSLVSSLVDADFASVDEAKSFQDKVADIFEALLNDTDDIDDYMMLSSLEATALEYLRDTMADRAVVIDKEVKATTNILTFAFDTYNDLERVDEIMSRNGFSQGLFITPSKVKVLSK